MGRRQALACGRSEATSQLGERYNGIVEVVGSIPSGSTIKTLGEARGFCPFWGNKVSVLEVLAAARATPDISSFFRPGFMWRSTEVGPIYLDLEIGRDVGCPYLGRIRASVALISIPDI